MSTTTSATEGFDVTAAPERARAFLAEQAAHRSLVVFVGAGVSANAGLPAWQQFVAPLAAQLGVSPGTDVLDLAQWYVDAYGRPPSFST
jgi:hypothetical protein